MSMASVTSARALNEWHPGEIAVQETMSLPARVSTGAVVNHLPVQHRLFHTTRLHFLPVTTLDESGRPWVSVLTAKDGKTDFISSPTPTNINVKAHVWETDPIVRNLSCIRHRSLDKRTLISAVGIEVSTRRRNKFAGYVIDTVLRDETLELDLAVNQALGLCPKYINLRKLEPFLQATPRTIHDKRELQPGERLPEDVIGFIGEADTAYIGTSYVALPGDEERHPSHVSTNHRGGRPGFVRIRPADGLNLVLPNFNGNRLMNSMGNIHVTPLASLVFPSFTTGSVLYVTGNARNHFGQAAREIMPGANVLVTIHVTGYIFVENALPLREASGSSATLSPYCPPIRYLAAEKPPKDKYDDVMLALTSAKIHNDTLATLTFESSRSIEIAPGGNVILDLSELLRVRSHEILEWTENRAFENDDCVRTWTVSVPPTELHPRLFSITVRRVNGGLITPVLHQIVNKFSEGFGHNQDIPLSSYKLSVRLRGIGGDVTVPVPIPACDGGRKLLWIAGGIGITPFLSLTRYVSKWAAINIGLWDIELVFSTREPNSILLFLSDAFDSLRNIPEPEDFSFMIHLFVPLEQKNTVVIPESWPIGVKVRIQEGRLVTDGSFFSELQAKDREPHICGPLPFILTAMEAMANAGVNPEHIKRERFTY